MTEQAFLEAICDNPEDDTPRLVFADWLEENGQPERAEFILVQIEMASLGQDDPRRPALADRSRALFFDPTAAWGRELRELLTYSAWERGFVWRVALTAARFLAHAEAIFRLAPVREVRLERAGTRVAVVLYVVLLAYQVHLCGWTAG
jgi:uncharacterized protein (TIGR02996 family)